MTDEATTGHTDGAQYLARELARVQAHAISSAAILIDAGVAIADLCATTDVQRTYIRKAIGDAVDALIDGLYPQIGDECDE